jgi:hypothetical protein
MAAQREDVEIHFWLHKPTFDSHRTEILKYLTLLEEQKSLDRPRSRPINSLFDRLPCITRSIIKSIDRLSLDSDKSGFFFVAVMILKSLVNLH